jgi:hypothetical protein
MYTLMLAGCLILGSMSLYSADALPGYIQVEVDNLTQQIAELKIQRDQTTTQLNAIPADNTDPNISFTKEQLQTQLNRLNSQISYLENQKQILQKQ